MSRTINGVKSFSMFSDKPFSDMHNFVAVIYNKSEKIAEVQVSLELTKHEPHEIIGTIIGSSKTDRIIRKYLEDNNLISFSLKSKNSNYEISSEKVSLESSYGMYMSTDEREYNDFIGELYFEDITIKSVGHQNSKTRSLMFYLNGPRFMWEIREKGYLSYTGEKKNKIYPSNIILRNFKNFKLRTYPYYFWDSRDTNTKSGEYSSVQAMEFYTNLPLNEYPDKKFISEAILFANDITLLSSFISRARIEWYKYELYNSNQFIRYHRNYKGSSIRKLIDSDTMIDKRKSKVFLIKALHKIKSLREQDVDLFMPIAYALSGYKSKSIEQSFIYFFLALERMLHQIRKRKNIKFTELSNSKIEKIKSEIETKLNKESKDLLLKKLGIINNIPAKDQLKKILQSYDIDWKNLYPEGEEFSILRTRNDIFHSNRKLEIEDLILEKMRLQVIVEKLILILLGNEDFSRIPGQYKWRILTKDIKLTLN